MTPLELLQQLNDLDEHPRIEAKEGSAMGKSILESVCAFANEPGLGGGWLLLGVKPDEQAFWRQYEVVAIPNSDQLQADLASQCAAVFNIPIRPKIEIAEIQGKRVISVFVPESPASSKPLFFKATGLPKGAYRRIGSVDALNASHHLRRLRDQGLLDQRGKGSATFYVPGERFIASLDLESSGLPATAIPEVLSGHLPSLSGNLVPLSGNLHHLLQALPENLQTDLKSLKKRVSQPILSNLIKSLCRQRAFTADELATLLGKNRKYVLGRLLAPLRRQGHLELTIPDQPNHPDQAYITPEDP